MGVNALPKSMLDEYKSLYCQYTAYIALSGKPIDIFGQSGRSSLQLYRAQIILGFYLEDYSCEDWIKPSDTYNGAAKGKIADAMANNEAKFDMPNGAHEQPGAGEFLHGQSLYAHETPVKGGAWLMDRDMNHCDAAFKEIVLLVHDNGILL